MSESQIQVANPFLTLPYEPALENLGNDYYDVVVAAEFPQHWLRFRNNRLLPFIGLDPTTVTDDHYIEAFGKFQGRSPLLALRYHGYQFGEYNPALGDGRGFLYGQLRGRDAALYDLGTKGSGTTPYSRGGDGRLTLKGGVREVLAATALERQGVLTSRCFSLIETGESLWRGDEPSPTRSSVMVRFSRSHIRFGTFERLHYLGRKDLIQKLLNHVLQVYYPHLWTEDDRQRPERYAQFYSELVQRVAQLAAQWMSAGFCHAVLNTDNMVVTGESFDYGPYAFIDKYNLGFTAAYFDYYGRYCYGNQPGICQWNLEMLQGPLSAVISPSALEAGLAQFQSHYTLAYYQRMLDRLGVGLISLPEAGELLRLTLQFLQESQIGYHHFFIKLRQHFLHNWRNDPNQILEDTHFAQTPVESTLLEQWKSLYHRILTQLPIEEIPQIAQRLQQHNPTTILLRPEIEAVWEKIVQFDDWQPFNELVQKLQEL